jgi:ppGpp synthetase/RelA/SpoT-type nucleotidyltranferase
VPQEDEVSAFLDAYGRYVQRTLRPAERALRNEFRTWQSDDYWRRYAPRAAPTLPTPTQRTRVRIKRPESVMDKIQRLPQKFPQGLSPNSLYAMRDVLGARVVTFFQTHLRMVDEEIRTGGRFELAPEWLPRSYIAENDLDQLGLDADQFQVRGKKPSGYASLHYVVRLNDGSSVGPWFELQVRTMVEEVWGEVEHQLAYKPEHPMDLDARNQFRILSEYLSTIDSHFNLLFHHSLNRQSESDPNPDDEITADNLPKVVNHLGYSIAQREISKLFDIVQLSGISTVRQLWDRASLEVIQAIVSTYQSAGTHADGFDVVAVLAALGDNATTEDAKRQTNINIRMTRVTHESRMTARESGPPPNAQSGGGTGST